MADSEAMDRWAALKEHQLVVLQRVADGNDLGDAEFIGDRRSARALADRRLVTVARRKGRWSAAITESGKYYLDHGQNPDRPSADARPSRGSKEHDGGRVVASSQSAGKALI